MGNTEPRISEHTHTNVVSKELKGGKKKEKLFQIKVANLDSLMQKCYSDFKHNV